MTTDDYRRHAARCLDLAAEAHAKGLQLLDLAHELHLQSKWWLDRADAGASQPTREPTNANPKTSP